MRNPFTDQTNPAFLSLAPFVLRIALGLIFAMHGWQKLQNGVIGVSGMLGGLGFPIPTFFAVLLIAIELGGGILLILGLYTGFVARILALVALIAWLTVHTGKGFFVAGGGYEFIMLIFAASISLAITGPGRWTIVNLLRR